MSDFLATIVARSIGAAPGILPRHPARFEPDTAGPNRFSFEEQIASQAPYPERPSVPGEAVSKVLNVHDLPPETFRRPAAESAKTGPPEPLRTAEPIRAEREIVTPDNRATTLVQPSMPPPAGPGPTARGAGISAPDDDRLDPQHEPSRRQTQRISPPNMLGPRLAGPISAVPEPALRHVITASIVESAQPWRLGRTDETARSAEVRPARAPDYPDRAASRPEPAPSAIHISIGRVEVRAPAAPMREARPLKTQPAVLPLTEYLRQRNGGA